MSYIIPTVKVVCDQSPGGYRIINEKDKTSVDEIWTGDKPAQNKPADKEQPDTKPADAAELTSPHAKKNR